MSNNLILDYIRATTNLYGIVPLEKVVDIYNQHNADRIGLDDIEVYLERDLSEYYIYVYFENFVHETIMEFDEFELMMIKKGSKPYYIPKRNELLKYSDMNYYEKPKQYQNLYKYIKNNFFPTEHEKAEMLCVEIRWECIFGPDVGVVFDHFNSTGVNFKDENQVNEVLQMVMELSNNVRLWENNGYTPNELFEKFEKSKLMPLPQDRSFGIGDRPKLRVIQGGTSEKIGRNDSCPCGSGKKYKKCCLGKVEDLR